MNSLDPRRRAAEHLAKDGELVGELAALLAQKEVAMLDAIEEMGDLYGVETVEEVPTAEERKEALKTFSVAQATGNVREWWVAEVLPGVVDAPDRAEAYLGIAPEEFEESIGTWAETYRDGVDGDLDATDRELADYHVREVFGVDLDSFESEIVEWRPAVAIETVLGGNMNAATAAVEAMNEAKREGETDG